MGAKVDREAVATLVLPQLWAFSMGPRTLIRSVTCSHGKLNLMNRLASAVLNVDQFNRFMSTSALFPWFTSTRNRETDFCNSS